MTELHSDYLQRFLFEDYAVRGHLVKLKNSYHAIHERHKYPSPVAMLLGKALAAATLISSTLKFSGSFILQTQTNGAVNLLVAQCNENLHLRGLAKWDEIKLQAASNDLLGDGQMIITLLPNELSTQRYQGIIALDGQPFEVALEKYFMQSEQLPTRLWIAADNEQVSGLLLQKLPTLDSENASKDNKWSDWEHLAILANTVSQNELLELSTETLLHRLFHEESIRLFAPEAVIFRCKCTIDKMEQAIITYGEDAIYEILSTQKTIDVTCEFCNKSYSFDKVDVTRIFHQ